MTDTKIYTFAVYSAMHKAEEEIKGNFKFRVKWTGKNNPNRSFIVEYDAEVLIDEAVNFARKPPRDIYREIHRSNGVGNSLIDNLLPDIQVISGENQGLKVLKRPGTSETLEVTVVPTKRKCMINSCDD